MNAATPTTFALAGPTASGKTAAALAIARACRERGLPPIEIISVDSALVYRGMDIGTAKPSAAERAEVPHHLIDVIEPTASCSAAGFITDTRRLIGEIHARGGRALLVGGTMLYFKALFDGIDALPVADPAVRAALDERARAIGWPAMHTQLATVDPVTAARLSPNDAQRIQRALEVWQVSGQPLSSFHTGRFDRSAATDAANMSPEFPLLSLEPTDRAWLHARIAQRFEAMLAGGLLVDEVQRLRARGDLHPDLPSMRCVGYRQTWEMLDGLWPAAQLPDKGIAATRQLAKRQITWLRGMAQREVIACDAGDPVGAVLARVLPVLEQQAR
ncbi:tRNA (adenosine(37)-N6)-dimethylallyltransferase MiaA [Sphaerotilus sp.]|uniref:tRNA (adenosine(37)-N6)-dimethylallyltransferase MiaA n=1 Tax=Sphaerotilus sp. TaxID=2093942 RepID=UPI00286EA3FA|nr:tRNA (adenosine(37)-N6)-dimethylallyltransferase MiaA [Sphaerotilus sp.]